MESTRKPWRYLLCATGNGLLFLWFIHRLPIRSKKARYEKLKKYNEQRQRAKKKKTGGKKQWQSY